MHHHFLTAVVRPHLLATVTALALVMSAEAIAGADAVPSHGDMAATIRSANLPCAHVQSVDPAGENKWAVRCNSGVFLVERGEDGQYSVAKSN